MAFLIQRLITGLVSPDDERDARAAPLAPERVVLPVRAGTAPSAKPPVRIFLGTEPAQYRAERVFVWSIEQVRDPARVYEIYLMKNLPGFRRRWWLTGFTNYRFAIPELAGGAGKAIYNDVDQIYLRDPGDLFDTDMAGHGFLSISDRDTSVMLMDCARMRALWTLGSARVERRQSLEARARAVPGLWGRLAPGWNARDEEYDPESAYLVHFTTIHAQPWRPFPQHYVYQGNPVGRLWHELERSADAAGYHLFTAQHPSAAYGRRMSLLREGAAGSVSGNVTLRMPAREREASGRTLTEVEARTVLANADVRVPGSAWEVTRCDHAPLWEHEAGERFDAVICRGGPELLPGEDLPWIVEALFARARRFVHLAVDETAQCVLPDGRRLHAPARPASRWYDAFQAASRRHPHVYWRLALRRRGGGRHWEVRQGGCLPGARPRVWVLAHHKAGHTTQSVGLAQALGWPCERKELRFTAAGYVLRRLLERLGMVPAAAWPALAPPWPDVVIGTGWLPSRVARWVARRSAGRTRAVLLGRKSGAAPDEFHVALGCAHFRLPQHPRRIDTLLPLTGVTAQGLEAAAARRPDLFENAPHPHILVLVGGSSRSHRLDAETARRLGRDAGALAATSGGTVVALTSRRTGARATAALRAGLGHRGRVHAWRPRDPDNPYLAYLGRAEVVVVTGESESMLAEAAVAGKPLYIYPVPARPGPWQRLSGWVARRARARPTNKRGTVRPQQGLEYLCARLVERGLVLPPRDLEGLHRTLIEGGIARRFGTPLTLEPCLAFRPAQAAAEEVRELLGFTEPDEPRPGMMRRLAGDG